MLHNADRAAVAAILIWGLVMGVGCGSKEQASEPAGGLTVEGGTVGNDGNEPGAPEAQKEAVVTETMSSTGAALDATTIVGTTWQAGPLTLSFGADGALSVNGKEGGDWKIENDQLTVSANNLTYQAQIRGDKIFYGDVELQKVEAAGSADETAKPAGGTAS